MTWEEVAAPVETPAWYIISRVSAYKQGVGCLLTNVWDIITGLVKLVVFLLQWIPLKKTTLGHPKVVFFPIGFLIR